MLIDSHSHLNFAAYKDDREEVIKRALDNNVWLINVGSQYETSKKAVEIAQKYENGVYAAIGLHPIHLAAGLVKIKNDAEETDVFAKGEDFEKEKYRELARSASSGQAQSKKVVAIGEIGFDYYFKPKTKKKLSEFKEKQKKAFLEQLDLAKELGLPVIFHCRFGHEDLLEILKNYKLKTTNYTLKGVIHCFTGNWEQAREYLEMGFHLGFNGIIYRLDLNEVIKKTPLEKILIETDCPYLVPPQANFTRNEPIFVKYVAEKIAELKGISFEIIAEKTTENAKNLFNINF